MYKILFFSSIKYLGISYLGTFSKYYKISQLIHT